MSTILRWRAIYIRRGYLQHLKSLVLQITTPRGLYKGLVLLKTMLKSDPATNMKIAPMFHITLFSNGGYLALALQQLLWKWTAASTGC